MFLNQLNEEGKNMFISLCVYGAEVNNDFAEKERALIQEYCKEMGIVFFDSINKKQFNEITNYFRCSETYKKRVVFLELLGLLYADGEYDEIEKKFANDFAEKIELDKKDVDSLSDLLIKYISLMDEMVTFINI